MTPKGLYLKSTSGLHVCTHTYTLHTHAHPTPTQTHRHTQCGQPVLYNKSHGRDFRTKPLGQPTYLCAQVLVTPVWLVPSEESCGLNQQLCESPFCAKDGARNAVFRSYLHCFWFCFILTIYVGKDPGANKSQQNAANCYGFLMLPDGIHGIGVGGS